jgi:hypothetical protein
MKGRQKGSCGALVVEGAAGVHTALKASRGEYLLCPSLATALQNEDKIASIGK